MQRIVSIFFEVIVLTFSCCLCCILLFFKLMQFIRQKITTVDGNQFIKRYKKIKRIGDGSFASCFLVKTENSDSVYALKIISKKSIQNLQQQKLVQEITIHQSLIHPNIVQLDHWFEDGDNQYIFLQYCENGNLQVKAPREMSMNQQTIKHYSRQILKALKYLQSQRILHRDLKLANFFIDKNNNIKLGDFGFACKLAYHQQMRRQSCGTPNYIAPEVISGFGYSFPSDIWSFGIILYRLKFGVCPFETSNLKQTLMKIKIADYVFPKKVMISQNLFDLIKKILKINYDERLTIQQIENHPFYRVQQTKSKPETIKRSSSIETIKNMFNRLFSPREKENEPKRIDSCQNFRDIKNIFKQKTQCETVRTIQALKEESEELYFNNKTKKNNHEEATKNFIKKLNSPKQSKLSQGINKNIKFITQVYSAALLYDMSVENNYLICYFTNGIRQILHENHSILLDRASHTFNKDGTKTQKISKTLQYIIDSKLKQNKYALRQNTLKGVIQNKIYISDFEIIDGYYIMNLKGIYFMSTDDPTIFYFHLQFSSYLYTSRLELVLNQKQHAKYKKIMLNYLSNTPRTARKILQ